MIFVSESLQFPRQEIVVKEKLKSISVEYYILFGTVQRGFLWGREFLMDFKFQGCRAKLGSKWVEKDKNRWTRREAKGKEI